ncbi:amino acid ABC transporter permease [Ensifer sp. Root127]|uniref:amino acid ABC transporter permease n=1 Tax=Ensifer sp. Root127 TaxID=1736440 RepID=UPI00070E974E|nr:amino acid ABC transporter permease [Ensifer sp. Root127]KQW72433.1 amino acid ABC transporter [Ensifer sp. Root127]
MFSTDLTLNDLIFLSQGAWVTIQLTGLAMLIGTVLGTLFGFSRASFPWATLPLAFVLDVFRSVPLLIQFVLLNSAKSIVGLKISTFTVGYVVLGIYAAALCTEVVRGGVLAVPKSVRLAGRSLGMTAFQETLYITFPLAARVAFPGWLNIALGLMKDSALVTWIGIIELLRTAQQINTRINEPLLVFFVAGLFYYVVSWVVSQVGNRAERRLQND